MKKRRDLNQSGTTVLKASALLAILTIVQPIEAQLNNIGKSEKHRIILLTDIGGDLDDQQSLTRFLMYADQYDIEGLVATSPKIVPGSKTRPPDGEPQPHYIVEAVKAYGQVRKNLLKHSEDWPETDVLLGMIRKGRLTGRNRDFDIVNGISLKPQAHFPLDQILGEGKDNEASMHIIKVVDRDDPRPVWVTIWGGSIELAQALWRVRNDRTAEELKRFISKIRVYAWGHQDASGPWILENFPDLFYIVSTGGILYSADPNLYNKEWLNTNVRFNHGPLGALCPLRNEELGDADAETFLGLIPNGLSDLEHPDWGGWGGRLKRASGSEKHWIDLISDPKPGEMGAEISRWAPHFQNDYQARMDWCVKEYDEANHPPIVILDHAEGLKRMPGATVKLSARGTIDPDGDKLKYHWWQFKEVGSYEGTIKIRNASSKYTSFTVPLDVHKGNTIHIICEVTDTGSPQLTRYHRMVVEIE